VRHLVSYQEWRESEEFQVLSESEREEEEEVEEEEEEEVEGGEVINISIEEECEEESGEESGEQEE